MLGSPRRTQPPTPGSPDPPTHPPPADDWVSALGELLAAEEAFALAEPRWLEGIDNVAMLLIDL
jgi:hypothetical protein